MKLKKITSFFVIGLFVGAPLSLYAQSIATSSASATTIAQLQALVISLQAQLAALIAARATGTVTFTRTISLGAKGSDVSSLQTILKAQGYYTYPTITGYFGMLTQQALIAYQKAHGLDPVGFVGPLTRKLLNASYTVNAGGTSISLVPTPPPASYYFPVYGGGGSGGGGGGGGGGQNPAPTATIVPTPTPTPTPTSQSSDITAPSIPINLSAIVVSSSQINVSWAPSSDNVGVVGYTIYRDSVQVGTSLNSSFSDTGLAMSTAYSYTISAYDAAGNTSALSASTDVITSAVNSSIAIGDRVTAIALLNTRASASTGATIVGTHAVGDRGTVIGGPTVSNGYTWWNVNYDTGVDGWNIVNYLSSVNTSSNALGMVQPTSVSYATP